MTDDGRLWLLTIRRGDELRCLLFDDKADMDAVCDCYHRFPTPPDAITKTWLVPLSSVQADVITCALEAAGAQPKESADAPF